MPDDRKNPGPEDGRIINVSQRHELRYWTKKFGCTAEELKAAVSRVVPHAPKVSAEIDRSKAPDNGQTQTDGLP
jgi:hypothetical protein